MNTMTWTMDPNGGGYTGIIPGEWKAYVLTNGTWTLYRWGNLLHTGTGKAPSVVSAKSAVRRAISA